jgi:hypothetical protein
MAFTPDLVGYLPCASCSSGFQPSAPLFEWTWKSNFSGTTCKAITCGGIFDIYISDLAQTASAYPPDPGSGAGGITITSINGVQQTSPSVTCTATSNTLWPPNGKPVLVTVSGTVIPGTQAIPSGGTTFAVTNKYGQDQPTGSIAVAADGSYPFAVPLIAARNRTDRDGRTYTINVIAVDAIGNVGSCAAVVTVPHDQGN